MIKSESIGVVDAKLKVYEKCKDVINTGNIFFQHIYEDFDEIAKLSAYSMIITYRKFTEEMENTFSHNHLKTVINTSMDSVLTNENIRELCYDFDVIYKGHYVGSVDSGAYNCRYYGNVAGIKKIITEETLRKSARLLGSKICEGILHYIENVVERTLSAELGKLTFFISDFNFAEIEKVIKTVVIEIFQTLYGVIVSVTTFIITIFRPVDVNSKEWRTLVADEIYNNISKTIDPLSDSLLEKIEKITRKTREDFICLTTELTKFQNKVTPKDQKQCKYI